IASATRFFSMTSARWASASRSASTARSAASTASASFAASSRRPSSIPAARPRSYASFSSSSCRSTSAWITSSGDGAGGSGGGGGSSGSGGSSTGGSSCGTYSSSSAGVHVSGRGGSRRSCVMLPRSMDDQVIHPSADHDLPGLLQIPRRLHDRRLRRHHVPHADRAQELHLLLQRLDRTLRHDRQDPALQLVARRLQRERDLL